MPKKTEDLIIEIMAYFTLGLRRVEPGDCLGPITDPTVVIHAECPRYLPRHLPSYCTWRGHQSMSDVAVLTSSSLQPSGHHEIHNATSHHSLSLGYHLVVGHQRSVQAVVGDDHMVARALAAYKEVSTK